MRPTGVIICAAVIMCAVFLWACGPSSQDDGSDSREDSNQILSEEVDSSTAQSTADSDDNQKTREQILKENGVKTYDDIAGKFRLGDTVETDIVRFTLDTSSYAVVLDLDDEDELYGYSSLSWAGKVEPIEKALSSNYFLPKEYDSSVDRSNRTVAPKGHILVSYSFTAENLDRVDLTLDSSNLRSADGSSYNFVSFYEGEPFGGNVKSFHEIEAHTKYYGMCINLTENYLNADFTHHPNEGFASVPVGDIVNYRGVFRIALDPENMDEPYRLVINLPTSKGYQPFQFCINAD